jgi:chemotaxis response regulator CheB
MSATGPQTTGVLVVDDDPLVRAGLVMMLGGAPDIRVVAEAGDGTQVLPLVDRHRPDVGPQGLPVLSLAVTRRLMARSPAPVPTGAPGPGSAWPC